MEHDDKRTIVIVGGGFAGADLAKALQPKLPPDWEVVLYSRENHFVFTPLLPDVVGSAINPLHVVWPVREMARGAKCRTGLVTALDFDAREIVYEGPDGEALRQPYDHLVIACGLAVNLHIVPGMAEHGWPLKTLGDSLALRNRVLQQLERAEAEPDDARRAELLSFAIVGGGFTGVEIAGALRDLVDEAARYYERFDAADVHVHVVEGGKRILGPMPESLSSYAADHLRGRRVEIRCGVQVEEVREGGIVVGGGELVQATTVISAVGNSAQDLLAGCDLPMERGRILVNAEMQVEGRPGVWALGDCAAVPNSFDGSVSPTLGQFAMRQASQLARNLLASIQGAAPMPFHYRPEGMFAAVGHGKAVGNPFGVHISGFLAFLAWRGIYWSKMPSLARKLQIAFDWAWDIFFARDLVEINTARTTREPRANPDHGDSH